MRLFMTHQGHVPLRAVPPLRYFVPNGFTALSLLLGLSSITMSVEGNFRLAAWMILWGVLLDKLDGSAARLLKATSKFGVEFDSFADFVVFGVAPAALIYYRLLATGHFLGWQKSALMAAAGLYALALAIRLSRFNVTTGGEKFFFGLPGTLLGGVIATGYLTWEKYHLSEAILLYSPAVLVAGAMLMISTVRLPKLTLSKNKPLKVFQASNIVFSYICGPLMILPEYLLGLALFYSAVGIVWCLLHPDAPTHEEPAPLAAAASARNEQAEAGEADDDDEAEEPHERLA